MNIVGVAAVLDQPMRGRPISFGAPGPVLWVDQAPITRDRQPVGTVSRMWVDGDLIRWTGNLDTPGLADGHLVGLAELTHSTMNTRGTNTVLAGWTVSSVTLVSSDSRPWGELHLAAE